MDNTSSTDNHFLAMVEQWLQSQPEILVLICYSHAAGTKSFEFFHSFETLSRRLSQLPPRARVTAFRRRQLPLRGTVDDEFIGKCLNHIQDGVEFLMVETVPRTAGGTSWFHMAAGESHGELTEALDQSRGQSVAVGSYPPWLADNADVISAIVPDEHGNVKPGIY
ncbi:MAG TPA: hypothetical protein VJA94_18310 [Candidatus Angelobacter sp.]